jgi:tetratricopeptide (TPR) repeat protein
MKITVLGAVVTASLLFGAGIGVAAKYKGTGIGVIQGKEAKEAAAAALQEAAHVANGGSFELIAVGRVYYLTGQRAQGQALFDQAAASKRASAADYERIGDVYAQAGENDKASLYYEKMLAVDPSDDSSQALVGAWYLRLGQREKGEQLLAEAMRKSPSSSEYYVRAAESLLGVPPGR